MVVPRGVDGGSAAAELGFVHHVVVNQRRVVKQLHGRGCGDDAVCNGAEKLGGEDYENRA